MHITLSHEVGQLGLLEREDASFLNATLRPLATKVIPAFQQALQEARIQAPLQLTSNDGTLISAETAQKVRTASTAGEEVCGSVGHMRSEGTCYQQWLLFGCEM